jgi:hypothetical protein
VGFPGVDLLVGKVVFAQGTAGNSDASTIRQPDPDLIVGGLDTLTLVPPVLLYHRPGLCRWNLRTGSGKGKIYR